MVRIQYDHQIFSMQKFGGISRYFANLHEAIDSSREFKQNSGILFSRNHYLSKPGRLSAEIGNRLFKTDRKIYRWNRRYSEFSMRINEYDVFHPTYYDPYLLKYNSKPVVLTVHDMIHELFPENFPTSDIYSMYKKQCITRADHIIAISENTKNDIQRFFDIPDENISVIHHGIDFSPPKCSNIKGTPKHYILYVGERVGYKNFRVLAEAFGLLSKDDPDLFLVLAGGGPLNAEDASDLAGRRVLNKTIQITVSDTELNTLYQNASCFVFPSLYEGFGLPILEAFKNKCPVILSRCSCFPEIAGEHAALYFDPLSATSLAKQIKLLQSNPYKRSELIMLGQNKLAEYPIVTCVTKTLNIYRNVTADF
jgi:glycosyltransferase involved in cell wall biosynthesis